MPIVIVDVRGTLIYWNEPAELLLGLRFEETGEVPAKIWREQFAVSDADRTPIPQDQWPLLITLNRQQPVSRRIWVGTPNGTWRHVEWTSFPFIAQGGEFLGVQSVFWEV